MVYYRASRDFDAKRLPRGIFMNQLFVKKLDRIRNGGEVRVLDLFAGCGGISLGFQSAGFKISAAVEIDEFAAKSHALNFVPASEREKHDTPVDITKVDPDELAEMLELGEPDSSGRRRPVEIAGSNYVIPVDEVIMSIGTRPNPLLTREYAALQTTKRGTLIINEETQETSVKNIFAGGDAVTGAATVILAMGAGKNAAKTIIARANSKQIKE